MQLFAVDTGTLNVTYHPKLYLVRSATKARLMVGSANLTLGGLYGNIEASLETELDLTDGAERALQEMAEKQLDSFSVQHPQNVTAITTPDQIDDLLRTGRLMNEETAPRPGASSTSTDAVPRIQLPVGPPQRKAAPLPLLTRESMPAWGPAIWEPVWTSKPLAERDLNIPTGPTTNRTGSINLDKGLLSKKVDHRHYFRDTVFSALTWSPGRRGIEVASARFVLTIKGVNHGDFNLQLSHTTSKTSATYRQHNAMTRLSWGQMLSHVANRHLLGRSLTIRRDPFDLTRFMIQID